jgi:hypothetical protein
MNGKEPRPLCATLPQSLGLLVFGLSYHWTSSQAGADKLNEASSAKCQVVGR